MAHRYSTTDWEVGDGHSSVCSSNTALSGDYSMSANLLDALYDRSSANTVKDNGRRESANGTKPRCRNRLQRVVREYALKVIFRHREEIYAEGLCNTPSSRVQRNAIWNTILMKVLQKYPSAVTTAESLKSLWRTTLSKIRRNKAAFKKYSMQTTADPVMDDAPSFCDIEMDIYRWLCTTPGFNLVTEGDNNLLPVAGLSTITTNCSNDVALCRSSSSSSISMDEKESVMDADEDFIAAIDVQPQCDDHPNTSAEITSSQQISTRRKFKHWGKAERDTLIKLVIHYKDQSVKDSTGSCENNGSNSGRIEFWNRILAKFREQHPHAKASTTSLKRLWRSSRDKIKKRRHDCAKYLNGAWPTGIIPPFSDAEIDLYRWLLMRSGFAAPERTEQSTTSVVENGTPSSDVIVLGTGEPHVLAQQNCSEAGVTIADLLADNSLTLPTVSSSTTLPPHASSSKHSLQALRLRLVQASARVRHLEDELRDISASLQMIDDEQQLSLTINEMERIKEENRQLSAENERLKKEKAEFLGSLSRYLTQTVAVSDESTEISSKAPSVTLPTAIAHNNASASLVDQHALVKDEPI